MTIPGQRVQRVMASYNRRLELDASTLARAIRVLERALRDGRYHTRLELQEYIRRSGIDAAGQRLAHLVMHADLEGVICSGPGRGKQPVRVHSTDDESGRISAGVALEFGNEPSRNRVFLNPRIW